MKVFVKTLKGTRFVIEVDSTDTVLAVKKQIEDTQGATAFPCSLQLLIYKGKVLRDETTMQQNEVVEDSFLVVMLTKGIPDAAAAPVAAPAASPSPTPAPAPAPAAQPSPAGGPNAAPLNLFPQGMPSLGGAEPGALDFLRNNPQFQALRTMVQANPQILQPMLLELGKQNSQLLQLINDNQTEFLQLINEPEVEETEEDVLGQLPEATPQAINVTPEEREVIERLEALGFDRARVIEAFLTCDRNELIVRMKTIFLKIIVRMKTKLQSEQGM